MASIPFQLVLMVWLSNNVVQDCILFNSTLPIYFYENIRRFIFYCTRIYNESYSNQLIMWICLFVLFKKPINILLLYVGRVKYIKKKVHFTGYLSRVSVLLRFRYYDRYILQFTLKLPRLEHFIYFEPWRQAKWSLHMILKPNRSPDWKFLMDCYQKWNTRYIESHYFDNSMFLIHFLVMNLLKSFFAIYKPLWFPTSHLQ